MNRFQTASVLAMGAAEVMAVVAAIAVPADTAAGVLVIGRNRVRTK